MFRCVRDRFEAGLFFSYIVSSIKNMAYGNQSLNCFYHLIISFLTEDKCIAVHKKGIQYDEQMYSYSVFQEYQRV